MIQHLINWSLSNRFVVMLLAAGLLLGGVVAMVNLPLDAVPDLTNIQVQILTKAPSLGPVEVEQFITFPIETAMSGLPRVTEIRSISRFGLSAVTVVFEEGTDIYWARNLVSQRLQKAREMIPPGVGDPELGPIATGMSEIYQFEVRAEPGSGYTPMDLREILDWQIAFQLRSVPGIVEVNSFGGYFKTYEVQVDPLRLHNYGISLTQLFEVLQNNNANAGGGYIARGAELWLIRGEGLIGSLDDIADIVVDTRADGTPIRVRDLGRVRFAPMIRQGAATRDGEREAVIGMAMMLMGENSRVVVQRVKERMKEIEKTLPPGVYIDTFYDRTDLVTKTIYTVAENISGGAVLVILMLLLLIGNLRAGLIVASAIPLSAACAFLAMKWAGVSANLMSLGAIDFGIIVDGAVVMVENCLRRAWHYRQRQRQHRGSEPGGSQAAGQPAATRDAVPLTLFREAAGEVGTPIFFAGLIVTIVFLPVLTLRGIEGKMFRPMAFTFMSALIGALVLSVTVMPVMASLFLAHKFRSQDTFLLRWAKTVYRPLLAWAVNHPRTVFGAAIAAFLVSVLLALQLGGEFIPKLDEGDIAIQAVRLPSVSLEASLEMTRQIERCLLAMPEVKSVVSKTGRPEIANDPMGINQTDILVKLKPRETWRFSDKQALIAEMQQRLTTEVPANAYSFTQPIELRVQELVAGVRSDIGISLYGEDLDVLKEKGDEIVRVLSDVPGAADVQAQQIAGLPYVRIRVDRDALARYGVNAQDVLNAVSTIGGYVVGQVLEGERRFPLQVRLAPKYRQNPDQLKLLRITDARGRQIPLSQLAKITLEEGPAEISRDAIRRRLLIQCNVRGRDLAGFVAEARRRVEENVSLPPGYMITWGGQFENLRQATRRLSIAVPVALALIASLLYVTFNSGRLAMLIFTNVPIAATGGILALWLRDMPFSISAGVGFIALFGIAVMNGVVLIEHVRDLRQHGLTRREAVLQGAVDRLRPVLMTATTDALGFIPMAISTGAGAEVQRPLATVVIGGVITSSLLTLIVVPAIYRWFEPLPEAPVPTA